MTSVLIIYAALMAALGFILSRQIGTSDFLIAGRRNSGWVMAAGMLVGSMDALWFSFFSGMGYDLGWGFAWMVAGVICGLSGLYVAGPRIKEVSTHHNMLTLSDWFRHVYGLQAGRASALVNTTLFVGWMSATFVASGLILSTVFKLDYELVILCCAAVVIPLLWRGGYTTLTRFDVLQMAIIALGLSAIYAFGFRSEFPVAIPPLSTFADTGALAGISLCLTMFGATFAAGDLWQRLYATRDVQQTRKGLMLAAVFFAISLFATAILGMTAKEAGYQGGSSDVLAYIVSDMLTPAAQVVFLVILMAAVLSTLNVVTFALSTNLARDYVANQATDDALVRQVKKLTPLVILLAAGIALATQDIMTVGLAVMSSTACMTPLLVISSLTSIRLQPLTASLSVFLSLIAFLTLVITGNMTPDMAAIPFALNLGLIVLIEGALRIKARINAGSGE